MAIENIRITRLRNDYSENLLPAFCNFDDSHVWNIVSGGSNGVVTSSTEKKYSGDRSIKITYTASLELVFNSGGNEMNFIAPETGTYIFSNRFFVPNDFYGNDTNFIIKVFINGVAFTYSEFNTNLYLTTQDFKYGEWNTYAQSLNLTSGDVLTFQFKTQCDTIGSVLYFDGFCVQLDDKNLGTPAIYQKSKYSFANSSDLYISETQFDVPDVGAQIVPNGGTLNLLTLINNITHKNLINSDTYDQLNIVSNSIKTVYRGAKIVHQIRISFNIITGTDQFYQIQIRRTVDNSIVYRKMVQRNADETIQTVEMTTRTLSATDPFVVDGFYLCFVNNSGASATIDDGLSVVIISHYQKGQKIN